jgi:cation diffusion facilitator family transporter
VGWGLGLSVLSSALNGLLAWAMFRAAREHRSIALEADARHLVTDVWTSAGVLVGLVGAALTGWLWLDAAAAILVALNILKEGLELVWRSTQGLMDEAAEPEVQATIEATLQGFVQGQPPGALRFDHVSTRRAGQRRFVDMHMHMPADWTLHHAAELRGQVERALMAAVPGLRATMIAVLQRVRQARVEVDGAVVGAIGAGLLVLVCAERGDTEPRPTNCWPRFSSCASSATTRAR